MSVARRVRSLRIMERRGAIDRGGQVDAVLPAECEFFWAEMVEGRLGGAAPHILLVTRNLETERVRGLAASFRIAAAAAGPQVRVVEGRSHVLPQHPFLWRDVEQISVREALIRIVETPEGPTHRLPVDVVSSHGSRQRFDIVARTRAWLSPVARGIQAVFAERKADAAVPLRVSAAEVLIAGMERAQRELNVKGAEMRL